MRILRALAVATILIAPATLTGRATAQDAEALTAANELFSIMTRDMVVQLTRQMGGLVWPQIEKRLRRESIDESTIAELKAEFAAVQESTVLELVKEGVPIYARFFTAAELREMVAFYKTPTGQKALNTMPALMGEFIATIKPRLATLETDIATRFDAILKARGYGD